MGKSLELGGNFTIEVYLSMVCGLIITGLLQSFLFLLLLNP